MASFTQGIRRHVIVTGATRKEARLERIKPSGKKKIAIFIPTAFELSISLTLGSTSLFESLSVCVTAQAWFVTHVRNLKSQIVTNTT